MPDQLRQRFDAPHAEDTACPFWFWNGDLEPVELLRQIEAMASNGIRAFMIHARVGLTVPYLSEAWFERIGVVLQAAADRGMKVWIYDEENWASGYAGGRVLAHDPRFIGQNLMLERHYLADAGEWSVVLADPVEIVAIVATRIERIEPVPDDPLDFHRHARPTPAWSDLNAYRHCYAAEPPTPVPHDAGHVCWQVPPGHWCVMVARQRPTDWIAAYSDQPYVDLLNADAVARFIAVTHAEYQRRFAAFFGTTVLGFFIDEPGLYNNFWDRNVGSIAWTHDLAHELLQRRGVDLHAWFPVLWEDLGPETAQRRFDYWLTIAELLHERCFAPLAQWCEQHGVALAGHLHWEEWLFTMTRNSANPFTALAPFHVPGVDKIDEVRDKLAEKLVASVAHAQRRPRVMSESFALVGWKLAPALMKRIIDYQYVRGVNWLACHGFYYSIEGFRRNECPPSEFDQNPWWPHSRPLWDYVARLSAIMARGEHVAPVALYYPIEHAWATMTPTSPPPSPPQGLWERWQLPRPLAPVDQTDHAMIDIGLALLDAHYDFDLVDWTLVSGAPDTGLLTIAAEQFAVVVVPPLQAIHGGALRRLLQHAAAGGTLLFAGELPACVLAEAPPAEWPDLCARLAGHTVPTELAHGAGRLMWVPDGSAAVPHALARHHQPDLELDLGEDAARMLEREENRAGSRRETTFRPLRSVVRYQRRRTAHEDCYFVVNESAEQFEAALHLVGGGHIEWWEPHTGARHRLPSRKISADRHQVVLPFGPWQSYVLILSAHGSGATAVPAEQVVWRRPLAHWQITVGTERWQDALESWHLRGLARYSGTGHYSTTFERTAALHAGQRLVLDLGRVFETAQVTVNGVVLPPLAWAPFTVDISAAVQLGTNQLEIVVANTNANAFEGSERPGGLLGPVVLTLVRG